jgi:hypothetical protein
MASRVEDASGAAFPFAARAGTDRLEAVAARAAVARLARVKVRRFMLKLMLLFPLQSAEPRSYYDDSDHSFRSVNSTPPEFKLRFGQQF